MRNIINNYIKKNNTNFRHIRFTKYPAKYIYQS